MIFFNLLLAFTLAETGSAKLELVPCPLIEKSAEIVYPLPYALMGKNEDEEVRDLEKKAFAAYEKARFSSVTVWQKTYLQEKESYALTLIPFKEDRSPLWQQLEVLKGILWGNSCPEDERLSRDAEELTPFLSSILSLSEQPIGEENDPFCRPDVIEKQTLFEGKTIRVLYPTSVLPSESLAPHFLLVPKECRSSYLALTDEEALEIERIARAIFSYFKKENYKTAHALHKNGTVGITVPHFHEHLVFFKTEEEEQSAFIRILRNVLFGSSNLSKEIYQKNRDYYRKKFSFLNGGLYQD